MMSSQKTSKRAISQRVFHTFWLTLLSQMHWNVKTKRYRLLKYIEKSNV